MNQFDPILERFNSKWTPIPFCGCWLWTGTIRRGKTGDERPQINQNGRPRIAYRLAYELFTGEIPAGMCVLHRCDVSLCVNPYHLFLGTHKDNQQDVLRKGRHTSQIRPEVCIANGKRTGAINAARYAARKSGA